MKPKQRENIVVADCDFAEIQSLIESMQFHNSPFVSKNHIANFRRTGKLSEIKRYAIYFFVGFRYFLSRRKYDAIVGWQQFYALIFCFFCSIFRVEKSNTVVALNFTYKEKKGKFAKIYRWFMSKCLNKKYLDYIHVPSFEYADSISKEFDFPRERIIVTSFGINDDYDVLKNLEAPDGLSKDAYALAIGRSNRDYEFLIRAWEDIDYPLIIISDTFKGDINNSNITLLTNVAGEQSYPYIVNCALMVIPIDDESICSGDTVLLTAMSLKRKIIVTAPSTLAEMYVTDKENAILTEKDCEKFKETVQHTLYDDKYSNLKENARQSFLDNFSRQSMGSKISSIINKGY